MRCPILCLTASLLGAALFAGCGSGEAGTCVLTHRDVPDQRYQAESLSACADHCETVSGYVCCYFVPDGAEWIAVAGDC